MDMIKLYEITFTHGMLKLEQRIKYSMEVNAKAKELGRLKEEKETKFKADFESFYDENA